MARKMNGYSKRKPAYTIVDKLIDQATKTPEKPFVYYQDEIWTYRQVNDFSTKIGRVLHNEDISCGSSVALMMYNCPEFIGTWFGIAKTGGVTAFINYNLQAKPLLHCLEVSGCKILIIGSDSNIFKAISAISSELDSKGIKIYVIGNDEPPFKHEKLTPLLENESTEEIPLDWRKEVTLRSEIAYVYTSGTTGLPKAARFHYQRGFTASSVMKLTGATKDDVLYTSLPLYHSSAGMLGVLGTIYLGCSIAVRKKFSASQFWNDCRKYNATVIQYIGETMRYICDTPAADSDKEHNVRLAFGNGLRPQVWRNFLDRFGKNIKIAEFYAASEGPVGTVNLDGHFGSVGSLSPLIKKIGLIKLIKYDREKDEICRDENGRCIEVPDGTPGLLLAKITDKTPFAGYRGNKKQTESKIIRNAFEDGDAYFNSGDLIRRDPDYHLFFIDRLGDTFRWKGENVSTNEVADILVEAPSIQEANVYGVEIPGKEGRAGMAVVCLEENSEFDGAGIYNHATTCLASYACPVFLRVKREMDITGTYKQKKVKLVEEGFSLEKMSGDPVYFLDHSQKMYVPLTADLYDGIISHSVRL